MKRIYLLFLLSFASIYVFGQEEIWGYNSLMGSGGGGLVYKVDIENDSIAPIHSFGYSYDIHGFIYSPLYKDSIYLYGITNLQNLEKTESNVFKYNIESKEFHFITGISSNSYQIGMIDEQYIYFYRNYSNSGSYKSYILKYDKINDVYSEEKYIAKENGAIITGPWIKKNNTCYFLTQRKNYNTLGTLLEYNPQTDTIIKKLEFGELKKPLGSLLLGENDELYGHTYFNGEFDLGGIFKINEELDAYEIVQHFSAESGGKPYSEMIKVSNEAFYGINSQGGEFENGTIYKFNPLSNLLETVYSFDTTFHFDAAYKVSQYLGFDGERKIFFYTSEHGGYSSKAKYLYSFDILNQQVKLELDYAENSLTGTTYNLLFHHGNLYTNTKNDTISNSSDGIYKYNFSTGEIVSEYDLRRFHNEENGMFPMMMHQGGDGNIYGLTFKGGKNNKGIAFEMDYYSHEIEKLFDLDDTYLSFNNSWNSKSIRDIFLFGTDHIIGNYWDKEFRKQYIFDFNTYSKTIDTLISLPYNYNFKIDLNSDKQLYFIIKGEFYEYDYYSNDLNKTILPDSICLVSIHEWSPKIYYGVCFTDMGEGYYSIFKWKRETNDIELVFGIDRLKEYYDADGIREIYVTQNQMIFGSYWEAISVPGWDTYHKYKTFIYDLKTDSLHIYDSISMGYNEFNLDFNTKSTNSIIEIPEKNSLLNSLILADKEIELINTENLNSKNYELEKSPFTYTFDFEPEDFDLGSDAPFEGYFSLDFFMVQNPNTKNYWLGRIDSLWDHTENWANQKAPLMNEDIYISKRAKYFPFIDTSLIIGDLFLEDESQITITPSGSLSCNRLDNQGNIKMYGNKSERASLIFEEVEEKGNIDYQYQSHKKEEKLLAMPVSEMRYSSFDSLSIWKYQNNNWMKLVDSTQNLDCQHIYKFDMNTSSQVRFQGEANIENIEFHFTEKGLQAIPNPYAASLFWDELNLSNLSHQAHYRFIEEDSIFISYVDGLGTSSPLIQPLDVVWVLAESEESIELRKEDRIHASQFEITDNPFNNKLSISVEGGNGKDITHIRFKPSSTAEFDLKSDAYKLEFSNEAPSIFTLAGSDFLSINQLPDTTMLDMAVSAYENGNYSISVHENINFDFLVLEDLILHTKTNLLKENYEFKYFTSDGNYPFKLYFKDWVLKPLEESDVEIYYYPESIVVRSTKQIETAEITIFDLAGRVAKQYQAQNFFKFEKPIYLPSGHYIVQLRTNDIVVNTKILVRK